MFKKRRTWPASSRRCGFSSGNLSSRTENSSPRFVAAHAIEPTPAVCRRRAVGICTVIAVLFPPFLYAHRGRLFRDLDGVERFLQILLKLSEFGRDRLFDLIDAGQNIGGLQSVSSDAQHRCFLRQDAVLT